MNLLKFAVLYILKGVNSSQLIVHEPHGIVMNEEV